jgi:hypothetical protein
MKPSFNEPIAFAATAMLSANFTHLTTRIRLAGLANPSSIALLVA